MNAIPVIGDPRWRVLVIDGRLVATAGTDEVWVIDDTTTEIVDELQACWSATPPLHSALSAHAQLAVAELRGLGAVGPGLPSGRNLTTGLVWSGDPSDHFAEAMGLVRTIRDPEDANVVVVVRTTSTLADWAAAAEPHFRRGAVILPLDLGAAHTVAIGPLVVPGHGPCLTCLVGRITRRWNDILPPPAPGATEPGAASIAAGMVDRQLTQLSLGHYPLAERTVSFDIDELAATDSPCLRSAWCPLCSSVESDGRLDLPW
jgi:bacteriocin biosynthesis cyclodehydratase domain-containing protein